MSWLLFLYSNYIISRASKLNIIAVGHCVLILSPPPPSLMGLLETSSIFLVCHNAFQPECCADPRIVRAVTCPVHLAVALLLLLTVTPLSVNTCVSRYTVMATTHFVQKLIVSPFKLAVPTGGYVAADEVQ